MTVEAARTRTTDQILDRALEDSGNHDPSRVAKTKPLHYDAYASLDALLHEHETGTHAAELGAHAAYELASHAVEHASQLAGGAACAGGAVIMFVSLSKNALYDSWKKADARLAQGASDAGVVAAAKVLDFDPQFKAQVEVAHGSTRAGERAAAQLRNDAHAGDRDELQLRAYRGFDKAAGYALNAAAKMAPLGERMRVAAHELAEARKKGDGAAAKRLEGEMVTLAREIQKLEHLYFAPIERELHADAAVGLGAQYALFHGLKVARGEESLAEFQALHSKARAAVAHAMPDPRDGQPRSVAV